MNEKQQITYMQARILRLASEEWSMSIKNVAELFSEFEVFHFIRECFGSFHAEGDEAILADVTGYLEHKGVKAGGRI